MSSSLGGRLIVVDTLGRATNPFVRTQLCEIYGALMDRNGELTVEMPMVQRQQDGTSCGLFAVAFMVHLAYEPDADLSRVCFDVRRMRPHLLECLLQGHIFPFPTRTTVNCPVLDRVVEKFYRQPYIRR